MRPDNFFVFLSLICVKIESILYIDTINNCAYLQPTTKFEFFVLVATHSYVDSPTILKCTFFRGTNPNSKIKPGIKKYCDFSLRLNFTISYKDCVSRFTSYTYISKKENVSLVSLEWWLHNYLYSFTLPTVDLFTSRYRNHLNLFSYLR